MATFNELIQSEKPVLIDFFAEWCGPCKMIKPMLERSTKDRKDIDLIVIDIDKHPELSQKYNIRSVPSILMFKQGQIVSRYSGQNSPGIFTQWVDMFVNK